MIGNYITVCCQGEQVERFINLCSFHNIKLWNIVVYDRQYFMNMDPEDFFALKTIIKKTKIKIRIMEKNGIGFWIKKQMKRKVFVLVPLFCLFFLWITSQILWNVRIEGNLTITDDLIEEFLKQSGIHYGMKLDKIPISELKTNMREEFEEITWVSMKLSGTCLEITVKENQDEVEIKNEKDEVCNLVAQADGIVDSLVIREGTSLVQEGQEVKKGDVLIEGMVKIPQEDGTVKEEYSNADGDVWLRYHYPINEKLILQYDEKEYTGKEKSKIMVIFQDNKWGWDIGKIPFLMYDYIEENIESTFLNFLNVPLDIKKITYRDYVIKRNKYTVEESDKILTKKLEKIIASLEEKGVQIIEKNVKIKTNSVYSSLVGELEVKELCRDLRYLEDIR